MSLSNKTLTYTYILSGIWALVSFAGLMGFVFAVYLLIFALVLIAVSANTVSVIDTYNGRVVKPTGTIETISIGLALSVTHTIVFFQHELYWAVALSLTIILRQLSTLYYIITNGE